MNEVFVVLLPGMMYFWVLFAGQTPMQEVLLEMESHTLDRILASPVTVSQFVLSKLVRCFLLCYVIQALLLLLSALLFGIHWGNPALLGVTIGATAFSMTGFLGFIYSLAKTKEQSNVLVPLALISCAMLGGCMFPFEQLPGFLQAIGRFTPNRWGIVAVQNVTKAKPLAELVMPLGILCGIGLAMSLASYFFFRRQLAGGARG